MFVLKNKNTAMIKFIIKHQPMEINALPERPWVEVGGDLSEWRNQTYLPTVDYYSKWIEVEELPSQTSLLKCLKRYLPGSGYQKS